MAIISAGWLAEAARLLLAANTADWEDCDVCAVLEVECPYHQGRRDELNDLIKPGPTLTLTAPEPDPVRPDDKVLLRRNGDAIPVREIMELTAEGGSVLVLTRHQGRFAIAHGATTEWARHERDRIIREIYDSPKRIVRVLEYDPMHESSDV